MIIEHHNSIAIITQEKTSLKEFSTKFSVLYERFKEDDIVLEELQKGYTFKDKIIRHTKVKIGKK